MIWIDIDMPKTCGQCFCAMKDYDYNTVRCRFKYDLCFEANSRDYSNRRLDGCPLHEVADSDTVSREAIYDALGDTRAFYFDSDKGMVQVTEDQTGYEGWYKVHDVFITIDNLPPSPTQCRPHGQWIKAKDLSGEYYYCSECKEELPRVATESATWDNPYPTEYSIDTTDFCPHCGADMRQQEGGRA